MLYIIYKKPLTFSNNLYNYRTMHIYYIYIIYTLVQLCVWVCGACNTRLLCFFQMSLRSSAFIVLYI